MLKKIKLPCPSPKLGQLEILKPISGGWTPDIREI